MTIAEDRRAEEHLELHRRHVAATEKLAAAVAELVELQSHRVGPLERFAKALPKVTDGDKAVALWLKAKGPLHRRDVLAVGWGLLVRRLVDAKRFTTVDEADRWLRGALAKADAAATKPAPKGATSANGSGQ